LNDVSKSSVVLDRELDEEKSREPSNPHPLPALPLVAPQGGQMVLHLRQRVEHG